MPDTRVLYTPQHSRARQLRTDHVISCFRGRYVLFFIPASSTVSLVMFYLLHSDRRPSEKRPRSMRPCARQQQQRWQQPTVLNRFSIYRLYNTVPDLPSICHQ